MAEQVCTLELDALLQLVDHRRSSLLAFCVLNFVFSVVATLENILVIRALMKASTIPATVKKLLLSLAFSDLAVGLCSQLMTASTSASISTAPLAPIVIPGTQYSNFTSNILIVVI